MPVVVLDIDRPPCAPCARCGSGAFHARPGGPWRCSGCAPPERSAAKALTGWRFAHVPGPPEALPAGTCPRPVTVLGLRTLMEETCEEELAAVRLLARNAPSPNVLADEAGVTPRGELE